MSTDFFDIALSLASSGDGDDAAWVLATDQTLLDVQEMVAAGVSWFQGRSWVASIDLQQLAEDLWMHASSLTYLICQPVKRRSMPWRL